MRKRLALILLGLLSSCAFANKAEPQSIDYKTGTPWLYSDLDGNVTSDTPTDLKDDFALYVNKDALLELKIPALSYSAGPDADILRKTDNELRDMYEGDAPESHDAKLAFDMYRLINDWDTRNAIGTAPLKELIDKVEGISSIDGLTEYFVKTPIEDRLFCLWYTNPAQDTDDSSRYIINVTPNIFLLDDSAKYRELSENAIHVKEVYADLMTKMLVKLGYSEEEAVQKFENCFRYETLLASVRPSMKEKSRADYIAKANNHYDRAKLQAAEGNVPIIETLEEAEGYPVMESFLVREPAFIDKLSELYTEENLSLMKDYLIIHGIQENLDHLDWECTDLSGAFSFALDGVEYPGYDPEEYREESYDFVNEHLGWASARLYVEKFVNPEEKERVTEMVNEILTSYHGIIEEADFISDKTRAAAIEKLENISLNILYPDNWEKYSYEGLDFASKEEGGSYWEALRAIEKFEHEKAVRAFSQPFDKEVWDSKPYAYRCEYDPAINTIRIMAAYAQGENYNSGMSDEELYAKLGTTIGHEISHAFDSRGGQYDKDGNLANWWEEKDYAAFLKKNEKLAAYFDAIHPWEGQDLDGERMTGEACADITGFKCILRIAAGKEGFDYDKFFRAYAQHWLVKDSLTMAGIRLNDEHPMHYLRTNVTLQQFDEFLDFYDIKEGDNMYLAPEDRVAVW